MNQAFNYFQGQRTPDVEQFYAFNVFNGHETSLFEDSPSTSMCPFSGYSPSTDAQAGVFHSIETTLSSSSLPQSSPGPEGTSPQQYRRTRVLTPSESHRSTEPSSLGEGRLYQHRRQDRLPDSTLSDDDIGNREWDISRSTDLRGLAGTMPERTHSGPSTPVSIDPSLLTQNQYANTDNGPWTHLSMRPEQANPSVPFVWQSTSSATPWQSPPDPPLPTSTHWNPVGLEGVGHNFTPLMSYSPEASQPPATNPTDTPLSLRSSSTSRRSDRKSHKKRTGRPKGYHFPQDQREKVKKMRLIRVCWRCHFYHKACSLEGPCPECAKVIEPRPCDRTYFPELFTLDIHSDHTRRGKTESYMANFIVIGGELFAAEMTCGYGPVLRFDGVVELVKKHPVLTTSVQYLVQVGTGSIQKVETGSWLLGYGSLDSKKLERRWWSYVKGIVHGGFLDDFPAYAFQGNPFLVEILQAVFRYGASVSGKSQRQVCDTAINYIIVAHTITRVLNLTPDSQSNFSTRSKYYQERCMTPYVQSRPLTLQLKYVLGNILVGLREKLLQQMHTRFRTKGTDDWATAMAASIILATGLETHQSSRQLIAAAEVSRGNPSAKREADEECRLIDEHFDRIRDYFKRCYETHRKPFNPISGPHAAEHRAHLDGPSREFVDSLRQLISHSAEYIVGKGQQPVIDDGPVENHPAWNAARLVSKLLRPFIPEPGHQRG